MPEEIRNKKDAPPPREKEMSFWDHLDELRGHLFRSIIAVLVLAVIAFLNKDILFDQIILAPKDADFWTNRMLCRLSEILNVSALCMPELNLEIVSLSLSSQFMTHMYISMAAGFVLAVPYVIWELFRFIEPAMYDTERKYARGAVIVVSLLFLTGVVFSYFLIVPLTINFLGSYQVSSEIANQIALKSYISTVVSVSFSVGVVFELPVLIYFLTRLGVVTSAWLVKNRRIMVVVVLVVAAIITPPDVFSQIMVAIPLLGLYEVSIVVARRVEKRKVLRME